MKPEKQISTLAIDDEEYHWEVRHGWLVDSGLGLKGLSFSVWREPGRSRELIIDCQFSVFGLNQSPKRRELIKVLRSAIKAAIAAGWDADSRGHAFRFTMRGEGTT
jgi:hypothetical protein